MGHLCTPNMFDEVLPTIMGELMGIAIRIHSVNQPHLGSKRPAALNPLSFAPREASGYVSLDCPSPESRESGGSLGHVTRSPF